MFFNRHQSIFEPRQPLQFMFSQTRGMHLSRLYLHVPVQ